MRAIEELRRLMAEATPGPWKHVGIGVIDAQVGGHDRQVGCFTGAAPMFGPNELPAHRIRDTNADLTCLALACLPALLDVAEAAQTALKHLPAEDPTRERFSEVVRDTQALRTALARLEEGKQRLAEKEAGDA